MKRGKAGHDDYDEMYLDRAGDDGPPWEIGGPQPALVALIAREPIGARVLDLGCGTGELALYLAARGHSVTGLDGSAVAITKARQKAAERGLTATFRVADATQLESIGETFDTLCDSGLLHNLDAAERGRYLGGLTHVCAAGATIHLLGVSREAGLDWGVTEGELRAAFGPPEWSETTIAPATVAARIAGRTLELPAFLLGARRTG